MSSVGVKGLKVTLKVKQRKEGKSEVLSLRSARYRLTKELFSRCSAPTEIPRTRQLP